jgi:K+-transporting ATPase ATPase C chain
MSIIRDIIRALRLTLVIWILTALVYPIIVLGVGQVAFPDQANGSIMLNLQGEKIGSALIGQQFTGERYFHTRPSTINYSQGQEAQPTGISGASNLAPKSSVLINRILETANELKDEEVPPVADLIYTSGSGLDPHISVRAAREQLPRVANARDVQRQELIPFINKYTEGRFLGIFGEPGVNVLKLNYALDLEEFNRQQNQ